MNTMKKADTVNPNTFKSGIFCCVNWFFSESKDFLQLLRPSRLDIVHFVSKFFPIEELIVPQKLISTIFSLSVDELDRQYQFVVVSECYSGLLFLFSMKADMSKTSFLLLCLIYTFS